MINPLHVSVRFFFAAKANEKRILTIWAVIANHSDFGVYSNMFRSSSPLKKRVLFLAGVVAIGAVAFVLAATLFPDATWDTVSAAEEKLNAIFPQVVSAPPAPNVGAPVPYSDDEGYAVLSAWKRHWAEQYPIIVRREMRPDELKAGEVPQTSWLPAQFQTHYRPAIRDLASKWRQKWVAEDRFNPKDEFIITPESALTVNDSRKGIPANAAGYFAFSPVGFNHTRSRAVIYVIHRDGRYEDAAIFLLKKNKAGSWEVEGSALSRIT